MIGLWISLEEAARLELLLLELLQFYCMCSCYCLVYHERVHCYRQGEIWSLYRSFVVYLQGPRQAEKQHSARSLHFPVEHETLVKGNTYTHMNTHPHECTHTVWLIKLNNQGPVIIKFPESKKETVLNHLISLILNFKDMIGQIF